MSIHKIMLITVRRTLLFIATLLIATSCTVLPEQQSTRPKSVSVKLYTVRGNEEKGSARLTQVEDKTEVEVFMYSDTEVRAVQILAGNDCATPGTELYALTDVSRGRSQTMLKVPFDVLYEQKNNMIITVYETTDTSSATLACTELSKL